MNENNSVLERILKERDAYLTRGLVLSHYPKESSALGEIYKAFSLAQSEFPAINKNKQGYGYKYAELSTVLAGVIPILSKNDLIFTQYITRDNILHTRIGHSSGQFFESQCKIPLPSESEFSAGNKKTSYIQEVGSRRTYVRRYEALCLLGIHPDEDKDGV